MRACMHHRVPHGRHLARGPLEGAEAAFRRGARRLNKHPILGLGIDITLLHRRYTHHSNLCQRANDI
jgi:hypothetical protein